MMKKLLLTLSMSLAALPVFADEMSPASAKGAVDLPPARITTPPPPAAPVEAAPVVVAPQPKIEEAAPPRVVTPQPVVEPVKAAPAAKAVPEGGGFWSSFNGKLSVGAMVGPTYSQDLLSDNNDGSLSGISTDKIGAGGKVYVDWQPWDYVGIEAAYSDLGKNSFRGTSAGGSSWAAGAIGTDHEAHGWELSLFTRMPVSDRLTLLLKGGAYGWNSKQTYYEDSGAIVTEDKSSGTDLTYGVGFEYDVGVKNRFFWRGELQHYTVDAGDLDSNALWIGIMYRR